MCQILFSKEKNPPVQALIDANNMNRDGFGFAWVENGFVKWQKGYEASQLDEELADAYMNLPFPKAIHFRLATHGGTTAELTHPFPIKRGVPLDLQGQAKAVLFHNGIWHDYDDRLREAIFAGTLNPNVLRDGMSDSRAMAIMAQRYGEDFLDILGLGNNKVLVLRSETWYTFGSWTEKEGWSASSSKIFRGPDQEKRKERWQARGIFLDKSGLPQRGEQRELGRGGIRGEEVEESEGRGMENCHSIVHSSDGTYLSKDYGAAQDALKDWTTRKGSKVN